VARLPDIPTIPRDVAAADVIDLDEAARSPGRDELAAALRDRLPELARELLGQPTLRSSREWRWGRHGSLSLVMSGAKAGQWFDHEAGQGGGFVDLIARELKTDWRGARVWAAERTDLAPRDLPPRLAAGPARRAAKPEPPALLDPPVSREEDRTERARRAAEATWRLAKPASNDHPYLHRKGVGAHGLRSDGAGRLIVPLRDLDGVLHTVEFIAEDGSKRYLPGGAKAGHFCLIGGPLDGTQTILICEGWATGASVHEASGLPVVAAMDAGNLGKVAAALRQRFPDAVITIIADNDDKPDRQDNPGVTAATKAARAIGARLAVPPAPGDANDLAAARGLEAIARLIAEADFIAEPEPTYPAPRLSVAEARARLHGQISTFIDEVSHYWAKVTARQPAEAADAGQPGGLDLNPVATIVPPRRGLPVEVGLGKSRAAREAIVTLLGSGALAGRKVIYAVPRHDLGAEQVTAFAALGVSAMLWKGRTAPDPTPDDPQRLMCLDPDATFDAMEVEQPVEQSCCKVKRGGVIHTCPQYWRCGYQAQKPPARRAQIIVCAHDSLFHSKPDAIGPVGLLVLDEAFWQAGLRGLDGKMVLTQDSLEPDAATLTCFTVRGKVDYEATNDLIVLRGRLWKVLQTGLLGPISHALLEAAELTAKDCRFAAGLERARLRDPGLLPGMDAAMRARRIANVLPARGVPWAPPGRAAALWTILAEALDNQHDAAGVNVVIQLTENGSVRALKLRWRAPIRSGWLADVPVLHLDATTQPELVSPYLPALSIAEPLRAATPHVRVRQVLGSPTSAKALTPGEEAPDREHRTSRRHRRDLVTYLRARAKELRRGEGKDLLVIGQKAAIDALRSEPLPARVDSVHFNALSGMDRWGGVAGMVVLGRTLPAPVTVETLAIALTGRAPQSEASASAWWYGSVERRIRLAGRRSHAVQSEAHDDPVAEAIRWSICEGELIQAIGRGRGVNRSAADPLQIDLLTDVVLPVTVDELLDWQDLAPARRDIMASRGVVLDNAADMARCFPDLWESADAARQDRRRSVTNGYYRSLYNSQMSHSSALVIYQPEGAGQKPRRATFDLTLVPDPELWLAERLGALALCQVARPSNKGTVVAAEWGLEESAPSPPVNTAVRLAVLSERLIVAMQTSLARRGHGLAAVSERLRQAARAQTPPRRCDGATNTTTATGGDK
jgi:putative DNA primase/helicase